MVSVTAVWLRRALHVLLFGVFFVGLMTAREVSRGEAALRASDEAFHRGDLETSVRHARTAALSYVPGAPHVSSAYERLAAIGKGAETEGRYELARTAWGAVRSSVLQTNHWLVSRSVDLEQAEQALTRLNRAAALQAEAGLLAHPAESPRRLVQEGEPSSVGRQSTRLLRLGLLAFGFGALGLGLFLAGWRALDAEGRVHRGGLVLASALCVGGAACWLLAVMTG